MASMSFAKLLAWCELSDSIIAHRRFVVYAPGGKRKLWIWYFKAYVGDALLELNYKKNNGRLLLDKWATITKGDEKILCYSITEIKAALADEL